MSNELTTMLQKLTQDSVALNPVVTLANHYRDLVVKLTRSRMSKSEARIRLDALDELVALIAPNQAEGILKEKAEG